MNDSIPVSEFDKPKLPTGLNILTILSIIGCVLQFGGSIWTYFSAKKSYDEKDKMLAQMNSPEMPAFAKNMMGKPEDYIATVTKSYENRLPILLLSLVAVALCFYGVMQMRKLKKQGFLFYTVGELLPFVTMALFIGTFAMTGVGFMFVAAIAVLFILLYAVNRKHLVY